MLRTSPSWTTYAFPSSRCRPRRAASACEPHSRRSSQRITSQRMNPRAMSEWMEPTVDVLTVRHDELEPERFQIGGGIRALREAVEDGQERVGLTELARNLRAPGHVDDADRRGRHLLRSDRLREPIEAI